MKKKREVYLKSVIFLFICISVDTVKTRLQGQPLHRSTIKYSNMVQAYKLIYKEEGLVRGLYSGITPAMLGSGIYITLHVYRTTIITYPLLRSSGYSAIFWHLRIHETKFNGK